MGKYYAMFRMRLIEGFQYRAAAIAGVATQFFFGFMFVMVYRAFYASTTVPQTMTLEEVVSYLWLKQAFLALCTVWAQDDDLLDSIVNGTVAYEYCRPYDLYGFWFSRVLAMKLSAVLLRCFPILIITGFLPAGYRMNPPAGPLALLLFVISLALGLVITIAVSMFIYLSTFLTLNARGSKLMLSMIADFFSGMMIPILLMPDWLQPLVKSLPFAYMADVPFRVYSGNIPAGEAGQGILIQLVWIVLLMGLGFACFSRIQKRIVVQGG